MGTALKQPRDGNDTLGRHTKRGPFPSRVVDDAEMFSEAIEPVGPEDRIGRMAWFAHAPHAYAAYFTGASENYTASSPIFRNAEYDPAMPHMTVGERIAALREEHHETQADLAAHVGCEAAMIGHIEKGRRNLTARMLMAVAQHYRVSADWLWNGDLAGMEGPEAEIARALVDASPQTLDAVRAVLALARPRK